MLPPNGRIDAHQSTFACDRIRAPPRHAGGFDGSRCRSSAGLLGGAGLGLLVGAVVGIPLAVFVVYRVYSRQS